MSLHSLGTSLHLNLYYSLTPLLPFDSNTFNRQLYVGVNIISTTLIFKGENLNLIHQRGEFKMAKYSFFLQ